MGCFLFANILFDNISYALYTHPQEIRTMTIPVLQTTTTNIAYGDFLQGFERRHDLESHGGVVLIGSHPARTLIDSKEEAWNIASRNPTLRRALFNYLSKQTAFIQRGSNSGPVERDTEQLIDLIDNKLYRRSLQTMCEIMIEVALEVGFEQERIFDLSRMGRMMCTDRAKKSEKIVLLKISRGGDTPTHYAREHLEDMVGISPHILQASSQRVHREGAKKPEVVCSIKGKTDLNNAILMVYEQANASGETVANVHPAALTKCKSAPKQSIFCYVNSCEHGIVETLRAVPGDIVIVACLHNGLTNQWYLDFPGCGDCGAEEHLVQD